MQVYFNLVSTVILHNFARVIILTYPAYTQMTQTNTSAFHWKNIHFHSYNILLWCAKDMRQLDVSQKENCIHTCYYKGDKINDE
jgi:hypothetical protein